MNRTAWDLPHRPVSGSGSGAVEFREEGLQLGVEALRPTHRLHSSSFLGLPYRILNINHKKELLWSLWVGPKS